MSELTKEWLLKTIAELEEERDAVPGAVNEDAAMALAAMKIALASLEADDSGRNPVQAYADSYRDMAKQGVESIPVWSVITDLERNIAPLFTAPPAPVVPDAYIRDGRGRMMLNGRQEPRIGYSAGWNACRDAMLQGAEPVMTANKLPAEAAYGYFAFNDHHGEEFFKNREDAIAFCKEAIEEYRQENADEGCDPDEVRRTCWGIIMQEGTDIEVDNEGHIDYALTPELDGKSPVIPDGLRLALSNAGIAAPESDEMLAATCDKYIQALVTWVKERKPFQAAAPDFREISSSSTNNCRENAETSTKCWCRTCRPITLTDMRFVVCPECGNKRCPHANDHRNACTGSNEPGQEGSAYPAAPQQEVK